MIADVGFIVFAFWVAVLWGIGYLFGRKAAWAIVIGAELFGITHVAQGAYSTSDWLYGIGAVQAMIGMFLAPMFFVFEDHSDNS